MSAIQTDISHEGMLRASEMNLFAACRMLFGGIPGVEFQDGPELMHWVTGISHPLFNGACHARMSAENADARIAETIAHFEARGVPAMWWHEPSAQPADLGRRLLAQGFTAGHGMPGMAIDLHRRQEPFLPRPALNLLEVEDEAMMQQWARTCCLGFDMPQRVGEALAAAYAAVGYGADHPTRCFLCLLNGEPAACAAVCFGEGVAGIYCVATVLEARRQGCGAAVTQACLDAARERGYRIAILQASKMGEPVYRRLGFEEVCWIETYLWGVGSE